MILPSNVAPNQPFPLTQPQLLPTTAQLTGQEIMCVQIPFNGAPYKRGYIKIMNIYDDTGIERHWPDAREFWGIEPLRHTRALLVSWRDPVLRLANGLYFVFGGTVLSGMPVNRYFDRNRRGLHADVFILKPVWNGDPGNDRVEFMHVPEELLYPVTMEAFLEKINNMA